MTLEAHHDLVVSRRPGDDAEQVRRHVVGPHGQGVRGLAGWVIALTYTQWSAEHIEDVSQQEAFRRAMAAKDGHGLLCCGIAQRQP
ncbi:hypothetical protein [Halomonas sp.]|jgi:hypothetical protein|uniref:hypothetical protein n=1 Tax=Halomonas sp. TaxID=1486246 RepID=UPI003566308E